MIIQLDSENADRDLTSQVAVLTHTPSASVPMWCQGLVCFGDGTKNLDGSGGDFELTVTVGGQTLQPDPQEVTFSTATRAGAMTAPFSVPANDEVVLKAKSPNGADTDVDVTAYLYQIDAVDVVAVSGDSTAADNLESAYDGTGYDVGGIDVSELNTAVDAIGSDGTGLTEAGGDGDHLTAIPEVSADVTKISGDSTAADNLESAYDGTGYDVGGIDVSELNTAVDAIGSDGTGLTEAGGTGDHLSAIPEVSADVTKISGSSTAADNVESVFTGTGDDDDVDLAARSLTLSNDAGIGLEIAGTSDGARITGTAGDGLHVRSDGGDGHGLNADGEGSGEGISAMGGATGHGIEARGGATSGDGILIQAVNGNSAGLHAVGDGSGDGIQATGGATGRGIEAMGGSTSGAGIYGGAQNNNDAGMELVANGTGDDLAADNLGSGASAADVWSYETREVTLADDAITASKFDEATAYPLTSADTGATAVARTGADGDTLETLSDQVDDTSTHSAADVWAEETKEVTGGTVDTCTTNTDMRGTDNAALAATALSNATWTDARAGYLDNVDGHTAQTGDSYAVVNSVTHGNSALKTLIEDIKAKTDNLEDSWENVSASDVTTAIEALDSFKAILSSAHGKVTKSDNAYTFYADDNTTPLFTLTYAENERTRS